MKLFEKEIEKNNRKKLINILQLPENIRELSEEKVNEIIKKQKIKVEELLKNMANEESEYKLSEKQEDAKKQRLVK